MPRNINKEMYYSVPEAAQQVGVSRMTMFRWITQGVPKNDIVLKVLKDPISNHYYIAEETVSQLATRFRLVGVQS